MGSFFFFFFSLRICDSSIREGGNGQMQDGPGRGLSASTGDRTGGTEGTRTVDSDMVAEQKEGI